MVENGFLVRRLWAAKSHENRLFFVNLLYAIERGSSPVYGTIFKIARFLDFEKLWLNQVSLVLVKGKCNKFCSKAYILKGKCGWVSDAVQGGSVFPPAHMVNQSMSNMLVLVENEGFTLGKFDRIKVAVEGRSVFKLSQMVIQSMSNMWVLIEK